MKKLTRNLLTAALVMALASCGGGDASPPEDSSTAGTEMTAEEEVSEGGIDKNKVYREEVMTLDGLEYPLEDLTGRLFFTDGKVRAFGVHYDFTLPEGMTGEAAPGEGMTPEPREGATDAAGGEPSGTGDTTDTPQMHAAGTGTSGTGDTADTPQMHAAGGAGTASSEEEAPGENAPAEPEQPEMYPGMVEGMTSEATVFTLHFAPDGTGLKTVVLDEIAEEGVWYGAMVPGEDGATYAIKTVSPEGGINPGGPVLYEDMQTAEAAGDDSTDDPADTADTAEEDRLMLSGDDDMPVGGEDVPQTERYYLVKFDGDGKRLWETELRDETADWYSVGTIVFAKDHGVFLSDTRGVSLYDTASGDFLETVYETQEWSDLVVSGAGAVYVRTFKDNSEHLIRVDDGSGEDVPIAQSVSGVYNLYNMQPAKNADFLLSDNTGIYTWNLSEEGPQQMFGFIDSDLNIESLESLVQVSEVELITYYYAYDGETSAYRLSRLTKVPAAQVPEKQVLTLGCFWLDSEIRNAVFAFNKENHDCRITVREYSRLSSDGSYDQALTQMNADIISGNAPDIMILADEAQIESYEAKGVFEPLDAYMENDPGIDMKDYMTNVFDAYRYKGDMYLLVPAFTLRTYAMKASDAAEVTDWNFREMERVAEARRISTQTMFGYPITNMNLVFQALVFDGISYIDWNEQKARFDSQQFIDLLDVAKKFPSEEDIDDSWWDQDQDALYRNGQALIAQTFMGSFKAYTQLKYGTFGEEVVFVGFPREEGEGGHTIMATARIAMNAASENKDGCWEFMRTFLLDDYQNRFVDGWAFPVSKKKLREKADKSMERDSYVDALTGERVYFDETFYVGGEEITIPPLTKEEADMLTEFLESVDTAYSYNETIMNIVQEEAAPFFAGQKSAQECARILQSRLQLYIDENS